QPGVGLRTGIHRLLALPTRHRSHGGHAARARVAGVGATGQRRETTGPCVRGVATAHPVQLRHRAGEETIVDIAELVVCGVAACSATGIVQLLRIILARCFARVGSDARLATGRAWRSVPATRSLVTTRASTSGAAAAP